MSGASAISIDMNRADRLLRLVQALRRHRRPVTADALAFELEVSPRTIYRDIATLIASRTPIRGEAGVGYVLEKGYDLPPLMFNADEIEAVLVGVRWLRERADPTLARAADDVIAKIGEVLPEAMRPLLFDSGLFAPAHAARPLLDTVDIAPLRLAIRSGLKATIAYADEKGATTERVIWPFGLAYFETARVVVAWCETREDFRHFRTDRIGALELGERYPRRRADLLRQWEREARDAPRSRSSYGTTSGG
jgi:predicted DNA-binding transcriptional regulator YafY